MKEVLLARLPEETFLQFQRRDYTYNPLFNLIFPSDIQSTIRK